MATMVRSCYLLTFGLVCATGLSGCYGDGYFIASGRVCEPSGAPIAGATVTLTPAFGTGISERGREVTSDASGVFSNSLMFNPHGTTPSFVLHVEKAGFKPSQQIITKGSESTQITLVPVCKGD